ncbi:MAG: tetratricopeptide repeat protein [Syntrophales bacterium]|nr:tetratricopeptide repeat protein [Syntrophales bacterium]
MSSDLSDAQGDNLKFLFEEGERFFSEDDLPKARICFEKIIHKNPEHIEAINNLGVISFQEGNKEQAIEFFEKALFLDPVYKDALLNLFDLLRSSDRRGSLIGHLEKAVQVNPNDPATEE